jgi:HK97 gp10 family phage protein
MLNLTLVGDKELVARLNAMPEKVRTALVRKVTALALKLEAKVKGKLSNQVLHVQTGALRRSIFNKVENSATAVTGKVASSGDVKYAGIHEFGGKTRAHIIEPKKAQALAFMMGGKTVFAKRVNHPGSKMPERSFLRSSLKDMQVEITTGMTEAVKQAVQK